MTLSLGADQPNRIAPKKPTKIVVHANEAFDIHSLRISSKGTPGGAADWIVNDILVDDQSQLRHKDLPGWLFGIGMGNAPRSVSSFSFDGLDVVEQGHEFAIVVTYVGPNPEGVPFFGAVLGYRPYERPMQLPIISKEKFMGADMRIISARLHTAFRMERLEIDQATDWVVCDLKMNGRSQFAQSGDVPGDVFGTDAIDNFVSFETCLAGNAIDIIVMYIGKSPEGAIFSARYEGSVVSLDAQNPPELKAIVEGETIVGTQSPRRRSQSEGNTVKAWRPTDLKSVDLVEQCSTMLVSTKLQHQPGTVIEARLMSPPDARMDRVVGFFVVAPDGKRAAIAAESVETLMQLDKIAP
jgi:hypothetical protein